MTDPNAAPAADHAEPSDAEVNAYFENRGEDVVEVEAAPPPEEIKEAKEEAPEVKTVPHQALHEERMRRKELAKALEENQAKVKAMEERFARFMQEKADPPPNVDEDPVAYLKYTEKELREQQEQIKRDIETRRAQEEQTQQWNQFVSVYQAQAQQFASQTPDFGDAYNHVMQSRIADFVAGGVDQETAKIWAAQEETAIVKKAFEDGVNPAERLYAMAKVRGYKSTPKVDDTKKMDALLKGVESKSLSGVGGQAPAPMSLEALADMADAEFEKQFDKIMRG